MSSDEQCQDNRKRYRKNVAAVILNEDGFLLACQRIDIHKSWQFPQGGIDKGESPENAVRRELMEEIGVENITIIGSLDSPIRYDWPMKYAPIPGYHGQEQYYFLIRLDSSVKIDLYAHQPPEFQDYRWVSVSEFLELSIGFKKEAYRTALQLFMIDFPNTIRSKPTK